MSKKKKLFLFFVAILGSWLCVTFYFFTQHSVIGKEAKINETIEFEDFTIELVSLVLYNYERKPIDFDNPRYEFNNKVISNLPKPLIDPYMRLQYLYSIPYQRDNEFYRPTLYGKCTFIKNRNDPLEYLELFNDVVSIKVWDSADYGYSSSRGSLHEGDKPEIDFMVKNSSNLFPIERLEGGFKIIVKELESGEEKVFKVDSQDFVTYKHNDLFNREFPFRYKL